MRHNARRGQKPLVAAALSQDQQAEAEALRLIISGHLDRCRQATEHLAKVTAVLVAHRQQREEETKDLASIRRRREECLQRRTHLKSLLDVVESVGVSHAPKDREVQRRDAQKKKQATAVAQINAAQVRRDQLERYRHQLINFQRRVERIIAPPAEQPEPMRAQLADARKSAGSVRDSCQAGQRQQEKLQSVRRALRGLLDRAEQIACPRIDTQSQEWRVRLAAKKAERVRVAAELRANQAAARSTADIQLVLKDIVEGVSAEGMGQYLSRASPASRDQVASFMEAASAAGSAKAGRTAKSATDPRQEFKRQEKAERERKRRLRVKAAFLALPVEEQKRQKEQQLAKRTEVRREKRKAERKVGTIDPAVDGSRPRHRQHEDRIARAALKDQAAQTARLLGARERGRAAACDDAKARAATSTGTWKMPHAVAPLANGCSLIALRGGPASQAAALAEILASGGLERWLVEPARLREERLRGRSRLQQAAGHVIAAWSDELKELAKSKGSLEEAAAYRVDEFIARMDLAGHRVAAYWHTDSVSGHPHIHIVWARVRDNDLSVWSLESRARTTALWLHARSNTVLAAGPEALALDVDALGGMSNAAVDAEVLMAHRNLSAHRRSLEGTETQVGLQDAAAFERLASVGSGPQALAGGIWRFGLGPEPKAYTKWLKQLKAAQATESEEAIKIIRSLRPQNRGYWLPLRGKGVRLEGVMSEEGLGDYLQRRLGR